jgi:hypothetical protein
MLRAMFSPIIRTTWLYLQLLVMFTNVAAGWCHGWVGTAFQLIHDTTTNQFRSRKHSIDAKQTLPVPRSSCLSPTYCDPGLTYCKFSQRRGDGNNKVPAGGRGGGGRTPTFPHISFSYWSGYKLHIIVFVKRPTNVMKHSVGPDPGSGITKTWDSRFPVRCRSELSGITKTFAQARRASLPRVPHPITIHIYDRFKNQFSRKMTRTTSELDPKTDNICFSNNKSLNVWHRGGQNLPQTKSADPRTWILWSFNRSTFPILSST